MHCGQRLAAVLPTWRRPRTPSLLDQIVAARSKRSLTTVIDTLGLDQERRASYRHLARSAGLPTVLVIMNTAAAICRERNRARDRPVPAPALTDQLRKISTLLEAAKMRIGTR